MSDYLEGVTEEVPLTLLPINLQCRFADHRLKVRVLPDLIHARAHAPELTKRESAFAMAYWKRLRSLKGGSEQEITEARRWLADRVGTYRAVYVAAVGKPLNWGDWAADASWPEALVKDLRDGTPPVKAELLPDFWIYRLYDPSMQPLFEGRAGKDVAADLALAPALDVPLDEDDSAPDHVLAFLRRQNLEWMVNFDLAKERGMAFEIGIGDTPPRFGALFVTGAHRGEDPLDAADRLDAQFAAHYYSDGFDILAQGTPTNNTELGHSGYQAKPDDIDALFAADQVDRPDAAAERAAALKRDASLLYRMPAADVASLAFGMTFGNTLDKVMRAELPEAETSWAMNVAIGPGLGNFFTGHVFTELGGEAPLKDQYETIDAHHAHWTRGGAAIPNLRVGSQPYGVLPTIASLKPYHDGDTDKVLHAAIDALYPEWRAALPLPTLDPEATDGRPGNAPAQAVESLIEVLGAVPHPLNLHLRTLTNTVAGDADRILVAMDDFNAVVDRLLEGWAIEPDAQQHLAELQEATRTATPLITGLSTPSVPDARGETIDVQVGAAEALRAAVIEHTLSPNTHYLDDLLPPLDDTVLPILQSYLEATDAIPALLLALTERGGLSVEPPKVDKVEGLLHLVGSLYDAALVPIEETVTRGGSLDALVRLLDQAIEGLRKTPAKGDRSRLLDESAPLLHHLIEQSWLEVGSGQAETLRLALLRLRALIVEDQTGAAAVLDLRLAESLGLFMHRLDAWIGSFANRRLATLRQKNPRGTTIGAWGWLLDIHESKNPYTDGFIHASSMNHAKTAALLRSGWKGYGTAEKSHPLSVNLTSTRVRVGAWILDGVRNGQALEEVLGARLERYLRDSTPRLDLFIDEVRLIANADSGIPNPAARIADGWIVARAYADNRTAEEDAHRASLDALSGAAGTVGTTAQRRALRRSFERIAADLDGVADLLMAQSVHSLAQGKTAQTASVLNFGGDVQGPVPALDVHRTERRGQTVTHRLVALFAEADVDAASASLLELANPALGAWLIERLPAAGDIGAAVQRLRNGRWRADGHVSLDDAGLSPADASLLAGRRDVQSASLLGRLLAAQLQASRGTDGRERRLRFDDAPEGAWSVNDFGLMAAAGIDAIAAARPLSAADLRSPTDGNASAETVDEIELEQRIANLGARLDELKTSLDAEEDLARFAAAASLVAIRVPGAIEFAEAMSGDDTALKAAIDARIEALADASMPAVDRISIAIGKVMPIVPRLLSPDATGLATNLANAQRGDDVRREGDNWWRQVRHVSHPAARLGDFLDIAAADHDPRGEAGIVQLPDSAEPWGAIARPGDDGRSRLCVFAVVGAAHLAGTYLNGLTLDSWTETIPHETQQTGIAFQHDAPTARAPQCVLLSLLDPGAGKAVHEQIFSQMETTLRLLKFRAVGPDRQVTTGHYFPVTYLAEHTKLSEAQG